MYVNPIVVGVVSTILAEFVICTIIIAVIVMKEK